VDGGYHAEKQQHEDDQYRESVLEQMGYHVLRFTNEEVLYEIEDVIERINKYFGKNLDG
jgi:very-short-patch-repair endonuclease